MCNHGALTDRLGVAKSGYANKYHPVSVTDGTQMETAGNTQNEDATDRVEEITDTWESSPLTEPELATDRKAKSPADPGNTDDTETDLQREENRENRTDH